MRVVRVKKQIGASLDKVWAVLADFPNIAKWNRGVNRSYATSDATAGVGATRHCDLAPVGTLEETIQEWQPEERLVISIDETSRLPIKRGWMTFTMAEAGESTSYAMNYEYEPKGGPLGAIFGSVIDGRLRKGFAGFMDQLEAAARDRAPT